MPIESRTEDYHSAIVPTTPNNIPTSSHYPKSQIGRTSDAHLHRNEHPRVIAREEQPRFFDLVERGSE